MNSTEHQTTMTRTIKASEIEPGMTITWAKKGVPYGCEVKEVRACPLACAMMVRSTLGWITYIYNDTVEVISSADLIRQEETL